MTSRLSELSRRMKPLPLALTILLAACSAASGPSPQVVYGPPAPPEISTIAVPLRTTLAPLLPQIEAQVPKAFHDTVNQNGFAISYSVVRDPLTITMIGTGIHAATTVHYSLQVCRGNLPCVSCGIDEPPRQAEIALHSHLLWDQSWRVRSATTAQPVHFPNRCQISFINYDITDRVIAPVIDEQLRTAAKVIDRSLPGLTSIRPSAQQIWSSLQTPYEVAPRSWLVFEPVDVGLAPLRGDKLAVSTTLTIGARSRIVIGEKPSPVNTPLPALLTREASGGIHIPFDIQLPYEEATRLASARFGNRTFKVGGDPLAIGAIRVTPAANGRIAVDADIDYRGGRIRRYNGPVHLEGTPQLDAATNSIVVPDLDYTLDAQHRNVFARAAERFAHDDLRARLRESAVYPLTKQLADAQAEVTRSLSRRLAPGVLLDGRADSIQAQRVTASPDGMHVQVVVSGSAAVNVTEWK